MRWLRHFKVIKGITLFELIVVIALVGIMAAIGIPSFDKMIRNRELKNAGQNLYSILNAIRSSELQHPQSLFTEVRDADYWVHNWKANLGGKYLSRMNDSTPDNPLLLTIQNGTRKVEYFLMDPSQYPEELPDSTAFLYIGGRYSVGDEIQGTVLLSYNGILETEVDSSGTSCDNGLLEPGEQCENDTHCGGIATCVNCICSGAGGTCPDGNVNNGEECDDGNSLSGDGCSAACRLEICGDGIVQGGEDCEVASHCPVVAGQNVVCNSSCACVYTPTGDASCGDGFVSPDDPNTPESDGEFCDPGTPPEIPGVGCAFGSVCSNTCDSCCGNGSLEGAEVCDAPAGCNGLGGSDEGSICNSSCSGCECLVGEAPSEGHCCPSGYSWSVSECALCGNGIREGGEQCDDGNLGDGDGCDSSCQNEAVCGDGILDTNYEECETLDLNPGTPGDPGDSNFCDNLYSMPGLLECVAGGCYCDLAPCPPGYWRDWTTYECITNCHSNNDCHETPDDNECTYDSCGFSMSNPCPPGTPAGTICGKCSNIPKTWQPTGPNSVWTCTTNDDGNECTYDVCVAGICNGHPIKPDGTACTDDGNQCTNDMCNSGACAHPNKPNGVSCNTGTLTFGPPPNYDEECTHEACWNGACSQIFNDFPNLLDGDPTPQQVLCSPAIASPLANDGCFWYECTFGVCPDIQNGQRICQSSGACTACTVGDPMSSCDPTTCSVSNTGGYGYSCC